ncbi:type I methionyl aminopeptidase [Krasilnikovia sp. M28-CT-15]|uniref:type I methionyl aminopeptidase n=1 Tax=Krasilnikovia sp. M28-CT-15 TaxID=3373540 RepID=UPI003875DAB3
MVVQKTPQEIELMARAGAILAAVHEVLRDAVRPGMTTADLDAVATAEIAARGGEPGFLGTYDYPAATCISVNDEIVHGIPSATRRLRAGDVVSVDCGVRWAGYHSDAACTWVVGGRDHADERTLTLIDAAYEALRRGIVALRPGNRLGDVSYAIGAVAEQHGLGVVAEHDGHTIGGHGIGRELHEDPQVLGRGRPGRGMRLRPGLVFAIEPMFVLGAPAWRTDPDGWTMRSRDGSLAAHWEHTVAITPAGPRVLTARPGERGSLGEPALAAR